MAHPFQESARITPGFRRRRAIQAESISGGASRCRGRRPRWTSFAIAGRLIACSSRPLHSRRGTDMKPIVTSVALLSSLTFATAFAADKPDLPGVDPVQTAFDKLVRAATGTDWPSELAARAELTSLAHEAVPKVTEAARSHGEARVRRPAMSCSRVRSPRMNERSTRSIRFGLKDQDPGSAILAHFSSGELKVHHANRLSETRLEAQREKTRRFPVHLSKSLAQLGEADVLPLCSPPCRTIRSWSATSATSV